MCYCRDLYKTRQCKQCSVFRSFYKWTAYFEKVTFDPPPRLFCISSIIALSAFLVLITLENVTSNVSVIYKNSREPTV